MLGYTNANYIQDVEIVPQGNNCAVLLCFRFLTCHAFFFCIGNNWRHFADSAFLTNGLDAKASVLHAIIG